jgi:hypothetical protein
VVELEEEEEEQQEEGHHYSNVTLRVPMAIIGRPR